MTAQLERAEACGGHQPVVGASLKGPTDKMLADLGMEVSAAQVARLCSDFADVFILDVQDEAAKPEIESLGMKVCVTDTVMSGLEEKIRLAAFTPRGRSLQRFSMDEQPQSAQRAPRLNDFSVFSRPCG